MKLKAIALTLGLAVTTTASFIPISTDMANASSMRGLFDSYNNSLGSHSVDGNSGRTWSGGQFSARWNRPQVDIVDFRPASMNVGCGGLDVFAGSFGLISGDELSQVGRAIAQGASVYFFKLAINSICSSCAAEMENISSALRRFNELSRNACEMTEGFLSDNLDLNVENSLLTFPDQAGNEESIAGRLNSWNDRILNRENNPISEQGLADKVEGNSVFGPLERLHGVNAEFFELLGFSGVDDTQTIGSALMTFMGVKTVRVEAPDNPGEDPVPHTTTITGGVMSDFILGMNTTKVDIVKCTKSLTIEPKCIDVTTTEVEWEPLQMVVKKMLMGPAGNPDEGIIPAIMSRSPLEAPQKSFINTFRIPVARWLTFAEENNVSIDTISDYIAIGVTLNVTRQIDNSVEYYFNQLKSQGGSSKDGPTLQKERDDAYAHYKESMEKTFKEIHEQYTKHEDALSTFVEIAQLEATRRSRR
jgi:hypothetical protein